MKVLYLDSSAFVKTVVAEPHTSALRRFLGRQDARRASSALLRAEALRAVRHRDPETVSRLRAALGAVDLIAIDDRILDSAGVLEPSIVRTLDAPWIDLCSVAYRPEDFGTVDPHYSPLGYARVGHAVAEALGPMLERAAMSTPADG